MEKLRLRHARLVDRVETSFQRYLLDQLPWNERLIGIKGARGVGKTTLLLQYIKLNYGHDLSALYISLDDLFFQSNQLVDLVEEFVSLGGEHLFIDEVHKYDNWSVELKLIYDSYPDLKVVFTGSSLLEILNSRSDLSRRALVYPLQGLSFREYLNFRQGQNFQAIKLEELLDQHVQIAIPITGSTKILKHFASYLRIGYFPFYNEDEPIYFKRLEEIINFIIELEIPQLRSTQLSLSNKVKQIVYIVSQSVPFQPNVSALASKIKVNRKTLLEHLHYLDDASVFRSLHRENRGVSLLQKPKKLYLENPNYLYALHATTPEVGTVRETFFLNQLSQRHTITYPSTGDFLIDQQYLFEVGGKRKTRKQIPKSDNTFVAADQIEIGNGHKIPLWLFGFLY